MIRFLRPEGQNADRHGNSHDGHHLFLWPVCLVDDQWWTPPHPCWVLSANSRIGSRPLVRLGKGARRRQHQSVATEMAVPAKSNLADEGRSIAACPVPTEASAQITKIIVARTNAAF